MYFLGFLHNIPINIHKAPGLSPFQIGIAQNSINDVNDKHPWSLSCIFWVPHRTNPMYIYNQPQLTISTLSANLSSAFNVFAATTCIYTAYIKPIYIPMFTYTTNTFDTHIQGYGLHFNKAYMNICKSIHLLHLPTTLHFHPCYIFTCIEHPTTVLNFVIPPPTITQPTTNN